MRKGQHHVLENIMVQGVLPIVPCSLDVPKMFSRSQEASASGQQDSQMARTHTLLPLGLVSLLGECMALAEQN